MKILVFISTLFSFASMACGQGVISGPTTVDVNGTAGYTIDDIIGASTDSWKFEGTGTNISFLTSTTASISWTETGIKTINYVVGPDIYASLTIMVDEFNSIKTINYDEKGDPVTMSKSYFNENGLLLQTQSWDPQHNEVFASEPIYDQYNRAVGQTLSAPVNRELFDYKKGFVTYEGSAYPYDEFNDITLPGPVDKTTKGTLGWYYSNQNTDEERVPETKFPFSMSNFYEDGSGESMSSAMPGDFHHLQSEKAPVQKVFPVMNDLDAYAEISNLLLNDGITSFAKAAIKTVVKDGNGQEIISYADESGNVLVSAYSYVSGGEAFYMDASRFDWSSSTGTFDFHIPSDGASHSTDITGYYTMKIENLLTGETILGNTSNTGGYTYSGLLSPGFYRCHDCFSIEHNINRYYNASFNFYNQKGQLIASVPPLGVAQIINSDGTHNVSDPYSIPYATYYTYDFQGRLLSMTEPDAGTTRYRYRKDGQIRYSQNQVQADEGDNVYSYTNYDGSGRPIESGECFHCNKDFDDADVEENLSDADIHEWIRTYYDVPALPALPGEFSGDYTLFQDFITGAVSSTESEEVQSWYSYDEQGRVTWYLQYIKGLEKYFLAAYEYDFLGNVLKVGFQPQTYTTDAEVSEALWHSYEYDKNQRLVKVSTSVDNEDYYEHARYEYFKHGPLKRVVLAEDLQGIDYTYTVQGWLKAINHPVRNFDPGGDGSNGVSGDEFGMTLEYFEGDYASEQTPLGSQNLDEDYFGTDFNGNIRATVFGEAEERGYYNNYKEAAYYGHPMTREYSTTLTADTEAAAQEYIDFKDGFYSNGQDVHFKIQPDQPTNVNLVNVQDGESYMYNYDDQYQLDDATYSNTGGSTWDNAYNVDVEGYDENGNIEGIARYNENTAEPRDDFGFHYIEGTNRLVSVDHYIDRITYNAIGQVVSIEYTNPDEKDFIIEYDVTGKVIKVADMVTGEALMEVLYDDRGFRMMKRIGNVEEWYVRDASGNTMAIYHKEAGNGNPISQQELPIYGSGKLGMAFKNPDHYKYIYELTDHLGNVRALVTKLGLMATATMEPDNNDYESQYFDNLSQRHLDEVYNHTAPGSYGALTNPDYPVGPATTLRVKAGDEINLQAYAKFVLSQSFDPSVLTSNVLTTLTASVNGGAIGVEGDGLMQSISDILNGGMAAVNTNEGAPKAYLQYILLDEDFAYVGSDTYAVTELENNWQEMNLSTTAIADGYLFAYVVNESNEPVYFDDFSFQVLGNRAIRKTDYYPFGAVAKVWNTDDPLQQEPYRHGYQGQYAEQDTVTGWNSFEAREYDPVIGRWMSVDPARQYASPYKALGNNPIMFIDPNGETGYPIMSWFLVVKWWAENHEGSTKAVVRFRAYKNGVNGGSVGIKRLGQVAAFKGAEFTEYSLNLNALEISKEQGVISRHSLAGAGGVDETRKMLENGTVTIETAWDLLGAFREIEEIYNPDGSSSTQTKDGIGYGFELAIPSIADDNLGAGFLIEAEISQDVIKSTDD